jgi:hypothetical protein
VSLEEEGGFGSGLMAKIEQLHLMRRGLMTDAVAEESGGPAEAESCDPPAYETPPNELELLRQREEELDQRERELAKHEARLARQEGKLARQAARGIPTPPAA